MEAVASRHEVAAEVALLAVLAIAHARLLTVDVERTDVVHVETNLPVAGEPGGDQVLHHLVLPVDGDRTSARQLAQRNAVSRTVELQIQAVMHEPLAIHALTDAGIAQQVRRALLQHACAQPALHVLAAATLEHHRLYALAGEQPGEQEPRGAGADDGDLGSVGAHRVGAHVPRCYRTR